MYYVEHYCNSAEELLGELSLRGKNFAAQGKYHWLFRGQSEPHPLLPRAWRPGGVVTPWARRRVRDYEEQVRAEFEIACRFFTLADRRGLPLPEDTQQLREAIRLRHIDDVGRWPEGPIVSVLALAQHYGLPTRLLDWSWNPYVAAYFAARDAIDSAPDTHLEVFALDSGITGAEYLQQLETKLTGGKLRLVTAPGAGNRNLRAQEGVFTLWRPTPRDMDGSRPTVSLQELVSAMPGHVFAQLLHRFTLQAEHAGLLLYLLKAEGISASLVRPGYAGVAAEVWEVFER